MFIPRELESQIINKLKTFSKAVVIYGARQVGKTTLVDSIIQNLQYKTLSINADEEKYIDVFSSRDLSKMKSLVEGYQMIVIDEAQRIPNIGINLKILCDGLPDLKIIATGSSSFELANKIFEPLTGRIWSFLLHPLSWLELKKHTYNSFELNNLQNQWLIYGGYPEIFTTINNNSKEDLLKEIGRSYLYKDVFALASIKYTSKVKDLLKLLAFQVGDEVSIQELSNSLSISREAIEHYIDLLEKAFIIFRLSGFSRNLRKEVTKMDKIYFYDLGIRNMVIDDFKAMNNRNDIGQLWENFIISERQKKLTYQKISFSPFFWRVHTGAEIDYVEEKGNKLFGYEFKYGKKKVKAPLSWINTYSNSSFELINQNNYLKFIS